MAEIQLLKCERDLTGCSGVERGSEGIAWKKLVGGFLTKKVGDDKPAADLNSPANESALQRTDVGNEVFDFLS